MKISALKGKNDNSTFKFFNAIGIDVYEIEDYEKTDETIGKLINDDYKTIWISNELAGFSEDIIKKYSNKNSINIIISPF